MSVAVLSAVYGGYDAIEPPPEQTIDADWILITEDEVDAPGWRVHVEPRLHMHPRLAAKVPKCLPWHYTNAKTTVWMDGSCRLLRPDSLETIVNGAEGASIAQIIHPWRNDILDEAHASVGMPKYDAQPVVEQAQDYLDRGHPRGWGLWATGLIVRSLFDRRWLDNMGERWLTEQCRWTYQDQISQPYVLRSHGMRPHPMPFALHGSGVLEWRNHASDR